MKIVSLSPSITEILFALGLGDAIVADTYFCDYPPDARKKPKAGDFSHLNIDKIRSFNPDVVITSTVVQKNAKVFFEKENFLHLHYDPRSLTDIYENILDLGNRLNAAASSMKTVKTMRESVERLSRVKLRKTYRVYCEEWFDPPMISGNWVPDLVGLAGGEYFPLDPKSQSREIRLTEIKKFDPEVIFLSDCGFGTRSDPQKIYTRHGWETINAVRNKRVIAIDESILNRPGPRIITAASMLQKELSALQP